MGTRWLPKDQEPPEFMRKAHLWPARVIQLRLDEQVVVDRVAARRIDPVTGTAYYGAKENEVWGELSQCTVTTRQRVIQADYDKEVAVRDRYQQFQNEAGEIFRVFGGVQPAPVNGDMKDKKVWEEIKKIIDQKLPKEAAQNPQGDD